MWRYLKAAFLAQVEFPLVGPLPLNLMAIAGIGLAGLLHPALWLLGLGFETLYLFLLASSSRFQTWVEAADLAARKGPSQPAPARGNRDLQRLVDELDPEQRQRLVILRGQYSRILALYEKFRIEGFISTNNREALGALLGHYARLLAARESILKHWSAAPERLRQEIADLEGELTGPTLTAELRSSKSRTLEILRVRLANQEKKETVLAEIDSELERIEQQFDLALENAAIGSKPEAVSADLLFDPARFGAPDQAMADFDLGPPPVSPRSKGRVRER